MSAQLSEVDGGPLTAKSSVFEYFEEGLLNNANGAAVVVRFQPAQHLSELMADEHAMSNSNRSRGGQYLSDPNDTGFLSWTYRDIHLASVRFTNALLQAGVRSEASRIMCLIPNGIEYPLLLWTTTLARLTLCCLDVGVLQAKRHGELYNLLDTLSPDVIVVPDTAGAESIDAAILTLSLPSPKVKLLLARTNIGDHIDSGWQTLSDFVMGGLRTPVKDEATLREEAKSVSPEHITAILFTSGTSSGQPKGCSRTVRAACHVLTNQAWINPMGHDSRALIAGANFRVMSQSFTAQTWAAGGTVVMPFILFDPEVALQTIQDHRCDSLVLVPFHYHSIIDHPKFRSTDVSSLQLVACGGDMVTKDLLVKLEGAFPNADKVRTGHGMTEGGGLFSWPFERGAANLPYFGGIAPLGKVDTGARMRVIDKDTGRVTGRGEAGELHVCSPAFVTGYLGGVKPEDFYVDHDETWFKTGDLSMISEDGSIYILGRIKDIIKRAGVPITPAALENCIEGQIKCRCSVIGIPHPTLGAEPFVVVQNFDLLDENQIKQEIVDTFGKDYSLGGAVSLAQLGLDHFPLNATSKIMKIDLLQPVQAYLQRSKV